MGIRGLERIIRKGRDLERVVRFMKILVFKVKKGLLEVYESLGWL